MLRPLQHVLDSPRAFCLGSGPQLNGLSHRRQGHRIMSTGAYYAIALCPCGSLEFIQLHDEATLAGIRL